MERRTLHSLDDLLGYVRITTPPFSYGQQVPPSLYERFDKNGACVERREIPPPIRVVYD